jgi:hypothetical protein
MDRFGGGRSGFFKISWYLLPRIAAAFKFDCSFFPGWLLNAISQKEVLE